MKTIVDTPHVDLTDCDQEPIHIPSLVQSHGALLVLNASDQKVIQVSGNSLEIIGVEPAAALGRPLMEIIGVEATQALNQFFKERLFGETLLAGPSVIAAKNNQTLETAIHRNAAGIVVEFVLRHSAAALPLSFVNEAISRIKRSATLQEFCDQAVEQVRRLTHFDRVMVYRFLEDGTGVVIAEAAREGVGSYLGHHFPAADIPRQARELYCRNWIRIIADVETPAIPLMPTLLSSTGQPLDMTHSLLRHVSPIHIEYLKNMGVRASTSLSIMHGDRLWGLIACHHQSPKNLSTDVRTACELVAHLLSTEMVLKERQETAQYRVRLKDVQRILKEAFQDAVQLDSKKLELCNDLLQILGATGFAVNLENQWVSVGSVPSTEILDCLVTWANQHTGDLIDFDQWPPDCLKPSEKALDYAGLLAIRLSQQESSYAFWFRPEWVRTIPWAGDPRKSAHPRASGERLNPRKSFTLWSEEIRGRSKVWEIFEKVWAREIRQTFTEINLHRNERRLARLNAGLEKEIEQRTEELRRKEESLNLASKLETIGRVTGGVAHDFNNLLLGITGTMEELKESLAPDDQRVKDINSVLEATQVAFGLTKQLLAFGRQKPVHPSLQDVNAVIRDLLKLLQNLTTSRIRVLSDLSEVPLVLIDRSHLEQILLNLVINARDAIEDQGKITLRTRKQTNSEGVGQTILEVEDTGAGMSDEVQAHIFEPFYSTKSKEKGTGLGLATVQSIVKQAGGEISVSSRHGRGTTFKVVFPSSL